MKIPKYIENILNKREQLAYQLNECNVKLDDWLEKNGADLNDEDICDAVISGCMIYAEPTTAKHLVMDYIQNKL